MKKLMMVVVIFVMTSGFVQAQGEFSAEDLELLEYTQTAYSNLQGLDSFQAITEQEIDQTVGTAGLTIQQNILQTTSANIQTDGKGNPDIIYSVVEQNIDSEVSGQSTSMSFTSEGIYRNGEYQIRFSNLPPEMAGTLPSEWVDIDELALQGMDFSNIEYSSWNSFALYDISEETVSAIKELPSEDLEGVEMRVFNIIWLPEQIIKISGLGDLFVGDQADLANQIFSEADYYQKVWIDPQTQLVLQSEFAIRIEAEELEFQGQSMNLIQDSIATTNYLAFDEPFELPE